MVQDTAIFTYLLTYSYNGGPIESHTWSIEQRHFQ